MAPGGNERKFLTSPGGIVVIVGTCVIAVAAVLGLVGYQQGWFSSSSSGISSSSSGSSAQVTNTATTSRKPDTTGNELNTTATTTSSNAATGASQVNNVGNQNTSVNSQSGTNGNTTSNVTGNSQVSNDANKNTTGNSQSGTGNSSNPQVNNNANPPTNNNASTANPLPNSNATVNNSNSSNPPLTANPPVVNNNTGIAQTKTGTDTTTQVQKTNTDSATPQVQKTNTDPATPQVQKPASEVTLSAGKTLADLISDLNADPTADIHTLSGKDYLKVLVANDQRDAVKNLFGALPQLRGRIINLIQDYASVKGIGFKLVETLKAYDTPNPPYDKTTTEVALNLAKKIARVNCLKLKRADGSFWTAAAVSTIIDKAFAKQSDLLSSSKKSKSDYKILVEEENGLVNGEDPHKNLSELKKALQDCIKKEPGLMGIDPKNPAFLMAYFLPKWEFELFSLLSNPAEAKSLKAKNLYNLLCLLPDKTFVFALKYDAKVPFDEFVKQFPVCPEAK